MTEARWSWRAYDDLALDDLHDIVALRQLVFVVEQRCAYLDLDGYDRCSHHLFARTLPDRVDAYLRVIAPGAKYSEPSIGRVVTHPDMRRTGLGVELMREGIAHTAATYPGMAIRIGAQRRLEKFYETFGFVTTSAPYDEDGIEHVEMVLG